MEWIYRWTYAKVTWTWNRSVCPSPLGGRKQSQNTTSNKRSWISTTKERERKEYSYIWCVCVYCPVQPSFFSHSKASLENTLFPHPVSAFFLSLFLFLLHANSPQCLNSFQLHRPFQMTHALPDQSMNPCSSHLWGGSPFHAYKYML